MDYHNSREIHANMPDHDCTTSSVERSAQGRGCQCDSSDHLREYWTGDDCGLRRISDTKDFFTDEKPTILQTFQPPAVATKVPFAVSSTILPSPDSLCHSSATVPSPKYTWKGSLIRAGPLAGVASLVFAILQIFASFAVLAASNKQPVSSWTFQPTVYLAVLTVLSNKLLAFAAVQGTVISWWRSAIRGTSLGQLHRDWGMGLHVYKALAAGRHTNILAFACILATFVAIDGPLLQRATSVVSVTPQQPVPLTVALAPELPGAWSGAADYREKQSWTFGPSVDFAKVFEDYSETTPITGVVKGCPYQKCAITVRAPALALESCESQSYSKNYTEPLTALEWEIYNLTNAVTKERAAFLVQGGLSKGTREKFEITTGISDAAVAESCVGSWNYTTCTYISAIGEYDLVVEGDEIKLSTDLSAVKISALANNTAVTGTNQSHPSTLAGAALAGILQFSTVAALANIDNVSVSMHSPGNSWFAFQHIENWEALNDGSACAPIWRDPTKEILSGLNEVLFRAGVYVAAHLDEAWLRERLDPGLETSYNTTGSASVEINVFHSDFRYFSAAAVVQAITVAVVAYTFYGYWRLGRNTTFSPLEMANAFDAPLLRHEDSNMSANQLAKSCGSVEVQYGIARGRPKQYPGDMTIAGDTLMFGEEREIVPLVSSGRISAALARVRGIAVDR
ncbi:uncharacterized protein LTR77_002939 [Saxophila tyrrhenica]|uniref:Uncharacterized protein n=1 Tax=Saxophila tyrrhenica TaxID=1690608 RepID=A0AAV9PIT3_9PEZI|nr:hypothetical protein LTR77_002939 [Saxophila tyrrhenica]